MSTAGKRYYQPGSPGAKLEAYFRENPTEELTYSDAVTKLGLNPDDLRALRMAVSRASRRGELESLYVIRRPDRTHKIACPVCSTEIKVL